MTESTRRSTAFAAMFVVYVLATGSSFSPKPPVLVEPVAEPAPVEVIEEPAPTGWHVSGPLILRIQSLEGFRAYPYADSEGHLTVGYGTKLPLSPEETDMVLHMRSDTLSAMVTYPLSRQEGGMLLEWRLNKLIDALRTVWPLFDTMPWGVKDALADMTYQMGPGGVVSFTDMLSALDARNWIAAAEAAADSWWASRQTPRRARRVIGEIRAEAG